MVGEKQKQDHKVLRLNFNAVSILKVVHSSSTWWMLSRESLNPWRKKARFSSVSGSTIWDPQRVNEIKVLQVIKLFHVLSTILYHMAYCTVTAFPFSWKEFSVLGSMHCLYYLGVFVKCTNLNMMCLYLT